MKNIDHIKQFNNLKLVMIEQNHFTDKNRIKPITLYNKDDIKVIFKGSTKKVIIGKNTSSRFKEAWVSFKAKNIEEAKVKAFNYLGFNFNT